ncbi:uncharacterized protein LOC128217390 [Mya arenaria]|uniref:uncharacterized protein LOC128217390 n=1 Tax=Mya arenaria TaxID=6604 RepID=UPI0022E43471|nr:uncharacterized protein LOC128217390 [Mya arenaria]
MSSLLFLTCVGLLCGIVAAENNTEVYEDKGQWQVVTNPCLNNVLHALNFPHPSDATKFIQCGLYGRMFIVQCPAGEVYDQATSSCINLKAVVSPPIDISSLGIYFQCTAQNLQMGRLCFNVYTSDKQFIQCAAAGNGRVITCPDQLIWDQNRQSCVFAFQEGVVISGNLVALTGLLNGANPCTPEAINAQSLFFSHPDPTKFIQCDLQGNAFVQRCPSSLVWNQYFKTCVSQLATFTLTGETNYIWS